MVIIVCLFTSTSGRCNVATSCHHCPAIKMKFKSLVIMDLESSGLPAPGLKPKITELSLVGVIVDHLTLLKRGEGLPRVLQKCNLCFYPKKRIDFEATEITGLDNFLLEEIPPWNKEACSLLANFLNRLPQPICFIAHNGMKFDFPLLKAEIFSQREDVLQDIDCADSLLAFRAILPMYKEVAISECTSVGMPSPELNTIGDYTVVISEQSAVDSSLHLNFDIHIENMQKKNETTPKQTKRLGSGLNPPPVKRRHFNDDENTEGKNPLIRKKLFGGEEKLTSYKLCDIYRHIHNRELNNGHRAETDTLALLECIIRTAPEFLAWLENNHLKFSKVPCMW